MNKGKLVLSGLALMALSVQLAAQRAFSLHDARRYATEHAYSVKDKQLELEKAKKTITETAAIGLPQVSAEARHQYNPQIPQTPLPAILLPNPPEGVDFVLVQFGVPHQSTYGLQASQLLFDGSYIVALLATRVFKELARNDLEVSRVEVLDNVTRTYGTVIMTGELVSILENNLEVLRRIYRDNQKLYNEGFIEEQDVDQVDILVNTVSNQLDNTRRQHEIALMLLKLQMGISLEENIVLTDGLEIFEAIDQDAFELMSKPFDLMADYEYRGILLQEQAARLQVKRYQMNYLPSVTGFINHQQNMFGNEFKMFDFNRYWIPVTVMGVSLNWKIFTGFDRYAKTSKARLDLLRVQNAKKQVEDAKQVEYDRAKSEFEFSINNMRIRRKNLETASRVREKTLIKYREGVAGSFELTQAENQLLDAQSQYVQSMIQLINAHSALNKILGNYNN
ncbi:TolC family protein [Schleiferia thermophila]|jgi:outer membrane protein TolC|uniref:Outer membrane protein TolC n=1 Tax=Schleiferia thermophila TaxID=884107 RepID=A0A369A274_9FLAO|nr:TolC family protein [Schleiferia thermophila]KFD39396.1 hypothetical protein AT05_05720 [Schleiferia thermophila str. Yellowstone]PMB31290.1 TolC family protein [Fischerella thermalis CCMEE 5319]RCX03253.1 outer membrane protein TolC [Schleiferia thermophila]GCD80381.1 transporter [Schleiferia thermophila]